MPVTIVATRVKPAAGAANNIPLQNAEAEIVKLTGTTAAADTGTYQLDGKPILDAAGLPVVVGLKHTITMAYNTTTNVITFTISEIATLANHVLILLQKD